MSTNPTTDEWSEVLLSVRQAYQAMYSFLEEYYRLTHADEIGAMLGGLSLLPDGLPADPGFWQDWLNAVRRVVAAAQGGGFTGADMRFKKEQKATPLLMRFTSLLCPLESQSSTQAGAATTPT